MRLAILTYHSVKNYGAILQCYALKNVLSEFGDVEVINYTPPLFDDYFPNPQKILQITSNKRKLLYLIKWIVRRDQMEKESRKYKKLENFIKTKLISTERLERSKLAGLNDRFDVFVAGSDQIWNFEMNGWDTSFLLDFANKKKISYAASAKLSALTDADIPRLLNALHSFAHISVREDDVCSFLRSNGLPAECDLDPTLLLNRATWEILLSKTAIGLSNYILIYYVNAPDILVSKAFEYAHRKKLKVVSLNRLKIHDDYCDFSDASIEEFMYLIRNATCVFTTSFHGMAFSTVFNTNFFYEVPDNSTNNNQRLISLARKLGLEAQALCGESSCETNISWPEVNQKLEALRKQSLQNLYNYLIN